MPCRRWPFVVVELLVAGSFACGAGPTTGPVTPSAASPSASATDEPSHRPPPPTVQLEAVRHSAAELDPALAQEQAPASFRARFSTSKGDFVVEVQRAWAPHGADRFYNLVRLGFFDDTRFFRAIPHFMVQFGIPGNPQVADKWRGATLADDPVLQSNLRGFITFAQTSMPDSRTTQVFINLVDNPRLDASKFAPFGRVVEGMDIVASLYGEYGEGAPTGAGPDQGRIQTEGNAYLDEQFPRLDRILSTKIAP